jgi:hypothetical protein
VMNLNSLPHIPGGITQRSQIKSQPGSYYKFTAQVDPRSVGGEPPKVYMREPAQVNPNPYEPSQAKVAGVSTVTFNPVVRSGKGGVSGLYGTPSDSPYANKPPSVSMHNEANVAPLVNFAYVGIAGSLLRQDQLRAKIFNTPSIQDTPVIASPDTPTAVGKVPVTLNLTPDDLKIPDPPTDTDLPECEEPLDYAPGTLQCPPGFTPLLNTVGREVGCVQTAKFDEVAGFVSQGLTPSTVYKPYTRKPLNQEWYVDACPVGTTEVRRVGNVVLCEGVILPPSDIPL